jgi:Kef-type K+ transport system membrane component KefB
MGMNKKISVYASFLLLSALIFWGIASIGSHLYTNNVSETGLNLNANSTHMLEHFLFILIVVICASKIMGFVFQRIQPPPVMGEVIAGLALGPSLLGTVAPSASQFLLPASVMPLLNVVAQVGVIIFMFLVGIELDKKLLLNKGAAALAISHASILCPFLLGSLLALGVYPRFAPEGISFLTFTLFMGVALSITAFPVLARIITDLKLSQSPMAALTLTCAAIDDVTAWCLLALLIGIAKSTPLEALITFVLAGVFSFATIKVGKPLMKKLISKVESKGLSTPALVMLVLLMLSSALTTEMIGIHSLFGAFLFGTLIPNDSRLGRQLIEHFEQFVLTLLLPIFFAYTGMRTQIGLLNTPEHWLWCFAIILAAITGKIGGATVAARWSGIQWRDSLAVGILMNTRGLVELVILNVGLDLGILSPRLFTMLVIMAVVTTLMTTPLFNWVTKATPWVLNQSVNKLKTASTSSS